MSPLSRGVAHALGAFSLPNRRDHFTTDRINLPCTSLQYVSLGVCRCFSAGTVASGPVVGVASQRPHKAPLVTINSISSGTNNLSSATPGLAASASPSSSCMLGGRVRHPDRGRRLCLGLYDNSAIASINLPCTGAFRLNSDEKGSHLYTYALPFNGEGGAST